MIVRKKKISEDERSIVAQTNLWLATVGTASRYGHLKCQPLYYPITLDKVRVFMSFPRCAVQLDVAADLPGHGCQVTPT